MSAIAVLGSRTVIRLYFDAEGKPNSPRGIPGPGFGSWSTAGRALGEYGIGDDQRGAGIGVTESLSTGLSPNTQIEETVLAYPSA